MIDFDGQAVVVTGAGRGLGRAYALELARRGAAVVVNDVGGSVAGAGADASVADDVVAEIREAGGTAVPSHDSVASPEGGAAIVGAALDAFGRVDAVVSNAGIFGVVPYEDMSVEEWRRMLGVHLDGGFYLTQPAFRAMKEQGYGRFVVVASNIGAFGQAGSAHYGAAKAGLIGLTNALAHEGAPYGILANAVLPVAFSRMVREAIKDVESPEDDPFFSAILPEHVVPLVIFLASRSCQVTRHNFSAVARRYARVFLGLSEGWVAPIDGGVATAEDLAAHLADVVDDEHYTIPTSVQDEITGATKRLGIG